MLLIRLGMVLSCLSLLHCADSGDFSKGGCTVTCPQGSTCQGNLCTPQCQPACKEGEFCGADRKCHKGKAPDSGVTVPPVDAGKKDKGTNPGKDNGTKKDKGDPNKTMCDSLAKEPKAAYCIKQAVTCNQASDCCAASTYPIPCGIYANKWACNGGNCVREGCKDKAECVKYATSMNIKTASEYGCNKPFCSFTTSYCAPQAKPCNKPSDCCIAGSKSPCGIYPNHFVCNGGKCKNNGCVTNGECLQFAKSNSLPNQGSYQCFKSTMPCYPSTSYCSTVGPKTCNKPSDCCVASSSIPCGTYGNSFRCVNSTCITNYCKNKQDCKAYAIAAKVPDPDKYNCVPH